MEKNSVHISVLLKEVVNYLNVQSGEVYLDATFGGGGHSKEILAKGGKVIAIDQDLDAIKRYENSTLKETNKNNLILEHGSFKDISAILEKHNISKISGAIFDLGISSDQLAEPERGFSFRFEGPLDMRMNQNNSVTAADLINGLTPNQIYQMLKKFGEVKNAKKITDLIVKRREQRPITQTTDLTQIIESSIKDFHRKPYRIHPATQVFQALRMLVNDELNQIELGLSLAYRYLKTNGRLVVISFHSLEDRIVKDFIREQSDLVNLTKKPILPSAEEQTVNTRSRSAKLRVAEKIKT